MVLDVTDMSSNSGKLQPAAKTLTEGTHAYLSPQQPSATDLAFREAFGAHWGVKPSWLAAAPTLQTLAGRLFQAMLPPGSRAAVVLPTADAHTRQILAHKASYIDIGADQDFFPRSDRLARLLHDDAVVALVYATPNPTTGVAWAPTDLPDNVWRLEDQSTRTQKDVDLGTGADVVITLWRGQHVAVCDNDVLAERMRRLGCVATHEPQAAGTETIEIEESVIQPPDWSVARSLGFQVSASTSDWALLGWADKDDDELAQALGALGWDCQTGDERWRRRVRLLWPGPVLLQRLAAILAVAFALVGTACTETPAPNPAGQASRTLPRVAPAPPAKRPAQGHGLEPSVETKEPPGVGKALHRVPVVGGCGTMCTEAKDALTGFAAALGAQERATRLPLFLDSARLVVDGERVGDQLSKLWLAGQVSPRLQALASLVERLGKASATTDGGVELQQAAQDATLQKVQPTSAEAKLAFAGSGEVWTIRLGRRGLEWLVTGIDTQQ